MARLQQRRRGETGLLLAHQLQLRGVGVECPGDQEGVHEYLQYAHDDGKFGIRL